MIAQHRKADSRFQDDLIELIQLARKFDGDEQVIRKLVQQMIPEFSSMEQAIRVGTLNDVAR